MLTTKRIVTDDDRQGGYTTTVSRSEPAQQPRYSERYDYNRDRAPRSSMTEFTEYERDRLEAMRMRAPQGSRMEAPFESRAATVERPSHSSSYTAAQTRRRYSEEDLMPSIMTMQSIKAGKSKQSSATKKFERNTAAAENTERKPLSQNAKLLIAVYAVIVFIALVLIIATGIASNRQADKNAQLENDKAAIQTEVAVQNSDIAYYTPAPVSEDYVSVNDSEVTSFSVKQLSNETSYEPQTNFFDRVLDFFNNLFGG